MSFHLIYFYDNEEPKFHDSPKVKKFKNMREIC